MPQMAPMNWLILFMYFLMIMFMFMNMLYFYFNKTIQNKSNKFKLIKNYNKLI
uniref:ATP synthase complex subunit 8 n=1 Tax=Tetraneura nigriabdominalis TaxID=1308603 RepID=A0A096VKB0_9HEMI|nr:ATP synthase F0 subunit 8 [Tetraneura nigriabdominalis]AGI97880.1 ATP synthase F0 subunit 8 [Tetraneura nigriabdominalis]AGI97881.1 ATP synthase F0 subunit 8 [Tetraneura nigriabdominalis]AGI97882.1 ATP synthase F0 subunit 8 [Tetraneura nigriabdominalis]AGI97883.1 ATP synthase F0 subunit 8 [Tetraneura nigriabdominalis]